MSQAVSEKRLARSRLYDLVEADSQRKTMLNAYKIKAELLQERRQREKADPNPEHCLIRTLDPLVIPPEGKFQHRSGALISPHTLSKSLELVRDSLLAGQIDRKRPACNFLHYILSFSHHVHPLLG